MASPGFAAHIVPSASFMNKEPSTSKPNSASPRGPEVSIVRGSQPAPPPDLTYEDAIEATRIDYARLLYEHDLFWIAHPDGRVEVGCCCSDKRFPATAPQAEHIRAAIRAQRGPVKK
jgi:hypothetical protein